MTRPPQEAVSRRNSVPQPRKDLVGEYSQW